MTRPSGRRSPGADDDRDAARRLRTDGGDRAEDEDGDAVEGADEATDEDEADQASEGVTNTQDSETDGTEADADEHDDGSDAEPESTAGQLDRSDTEVVDSGEAEPADPKWEKPDLEDIPEFEVGGQAATPETSGDAGGHEGPGGEQGRAVDDATAGMPNAARSPGDARIKREGTEGYVAALELCARLPEDVRLPAEAADLVPAAVEAELEQDVQSFAAAEFDNPSPHVDVLEFVERDDEVWLRLRLGVPPGAFADLDPDAIRAHALEELEGLL